MAISTGSTALYPIYFPSERQNGPGSGGGGGGQDRFLIEETKEGEMVARHVDQNQSMMIQSCSKFLLKTMKTQPMFRKKSNSSCNTPFQPNNRFSSHRSDFIWDFSSPYPTDEHETRLQHASLHTSLHTSLHADHRQKDSPLTTTLPLLFYDQVVLEQEDQDSEQFEKEDDDDEMDGSDDGSAEDDVSVPRQTSGGAQQEPFGWKTRCSFCFEFYRSQDRGLNEPKCFHLDIAPRSLLFWCGCCSLRGNSLFSPT